jgi:eukaryotic-like serine/threonine-protein kinase
VIPDVTRDADATLSDALHGRHQAGRARGLGETISRYVVLGRLGSGGMGVVYTCYDPELDRRVAVKLLHPSGASSYDATRGRDALVGEARALARLAHPNVVAVHDVGTSDDEVYVAMELVDGATLETRVAASSLRWRDVLDLYMQAGRGLAAAHAAGIVHRDFKPTNAMVGRDGRVRVMDFGLAREQDDCRPGIDCADASSPRHVGTPAYMSPEQYLGEVGDARSDQFSFCVALYEGLFHRRPFEGDSLGALSVAVIDGRLVEPPQGGGVPGWLRAIVVRGLAVDPEDRHPSMDALLDAFARGRTRSRRKTLIMVVSAAALTAMGVASVEELERRRQRAACTGEGDRIDEVWNDVVGEGLRAEFVSIDANAGPETFERTTPWLDAYAETWRTARTDVCVRAEIDGTLDAELADRAVACLEDRRAALEVSLEVLGEGEASLLPRAVNTAARLERLDACVDDRELARLESPTEENQRIELAALRRELARSAALQTAGRFDDAVPAARDALVRAQYVGWGPVQDEAGVRLGKVLERIGDYDGAASSFTEAFFLAGSGGGDGIAVDAAAGLVLVASRRAQLDDGMLWGRLGDLLLSRIGGDPGLEAASLFNARATVLLARGDDDAAIAELERALAITENILGTRHPDPATIHNNLGAAYLARADFDAASEHFEAASATFDEVLGPRHPSSGLAALNLGNLAASREDHERAIELFERALAIYRDSFGPNHPDVASVLTSLGGVHRARGASTAALDRFREALGVRERVLGPEHPDVAASLGNIGNVHVDLGAHELGLSYLERALPILERAYGPAHREVAIAALSIGNAHLHAGRPTRALVPLERAVGIFDAEDERGTMPGLADFLLAKALWETGDRLRALDTARSARATYQDARLYADAEEVEAWLHHHPPP